MPTHELTFLTELLRTDTSGRVSELLQDYERSNLKVAWRKVGDRANNEGTIQAAGDPARALVERITNGIDASIDKAHAEHNGLPNCRSPRDAATSWFAVPASGLHELSNAECRGLAQGIVTVTLSEGDGRSKRMVEVADCGKGLTVQQFPTTILSLNADNKVDKFYLAGAFGQGGSATFASSDFTVIATRSVKSRDQIAFTVVRYDAPVGLKVGSYVYLVQDGNVLSCDVPEDFGKFSTRVRHYGYDLTEYPSPLGPKSLYGRAQAILFDPVLPFWLDNRVHSYRRTIKGARTALNGAREEGDPEAKLDHSMPRFFSDLGEFGRLGIEYWVLKPGKSAPNKAFVNGTRPIVLTVNGQTHAEWSASLLRKDAELVHLAPRMVVHLDCNQLSPDAKRVLFVSNREESRRGVVQSVLIKELLAALGSDTSLDALEEAAQQAGTRERDESAEKEIRREVAKMLRIFGFSVAEDVGISGGGNREKSESGAPGRAPQGGRRLEVIEVHEPPTNVEIVSTAPVKFYPGQRRYVRIRTDANSTYHNEQDLERSQFSFYPTGGSLRFAGSSPLKGGHMRAIFAANEDAKVGSTGTLNVELRPRGAATILASCAYAIVEMPLPKGAPSSFNLPQINILPITSQEDAEWDEWNFGDDANGVAMDYTYLKEKDRLEIRYSTVFPRYDSVYRHFLVGNKAKAASFQKRYEIWLTTAALIHWQDTQNDPTKVTDENIEELSLEDYRRDELRRLAKMATVYAQREVTSKIEIGGDD